MTSQTQCERLSQLRQTRALSYYTDHLLNHSLVKNNPTTKSVHISDCSICIQLE